MQHHSPYLVVFWSPFSPSNTDLCMRAMAPFFARYRDIQCLDCRDGRDARTNHLLRQADLVVIALRQSRREFARLVCENAPRFSNYIFLIAEYVPEPSSTLAALAFECRIPLGRIACIPYTPRMREPGKKPGAGGFPVDFHREVTRAGQIILRALGF